MITVMAIFLLLLMFGIRIATNSAYNDMLKLFATIIGRALNTKTPIAAPKTHAQNGITLTPK